MQRSPATPSRTSTTEDAVMGLLLAFGKRMRTRLPGDSLDFGMVPILRVLDTCGPSRLSSVADLLGLDASTVSRHVKQLEDRGHLQRTSDPEDGRASRVALTAAGRRALEDHVDRRKAIVTHALENWSAKDREALRSLIDRLVEDLTSS